MFRVLLGILVLFAAAVIPASDDCRWSTSGFSPYSARVSDVAIGDGVAVAVGGEQRLESDSTGGFVSRSTEGVVWTAVAMPDVPPLRGVTWTGEQFVAVGFLGTVLRSQDGVVWDSIGDRSLGALKAVCGAGDKLFAIDAHGGLWRWSDGWRDFETPEPFDRVATNGQVILATGADAWYSVDGQVWEEIPGFDLDPDWFVEYVNPMWDVRWTGNGFLLAWPHGLAKSSDGVSWSDVPISSADNERCSPLGGLNRTIPAGSHGDALVFFRRAETDEQREVCWSHVDANGHWKANPVGLDYSTNGPIRALAIGGIDVAFGTDAKARQAGGFSQVLESGQRERPYQLSRVGDEWFMFHVRSWDNSGPYGYGSSTVLSLTRDLLNWSKVNRTSDFNGVRWGRHWKEQWLLAVSDCFEPFGCHYGLFVTPDFVGGEVDWVDNATSYAVYETHGFAASSSAAVLFGDRVFVSDDFDSWTETLRDGWWSDGLWTGRQFVLTQPTGWIDTSTDGVNWTSVEIEAGVELSNVESGGGKLVAVGRDGFSNRGRAFVSNDDGQNWSPVRHDFWTGFATAVPQGLTWAGDRFVLFSPDGVRESTDGRSWEESNGLRTGHPLWAGEVGGEPTVVLDGGVVFRESCGGDPPYPEAVARVSIPVVAHVAGVGGNGWTTGQAIVNPTEDWIRVVEALGDGAQSSFLIPPRAQHISSDVLAQPFGLSDGVQSVEVATSASFVVTSAIGVSESGGAYGQGIPVLGNSGVVNGTGPVGVPGLVETAAFRTNLGVANLGDSELLMTAEFQAPGGAALGSLEIAVPAHKVVQRNHVLRHLDGAVPEAASVVLRADEPDARYAAWASVVDNRTNDPSFRLAVAALGDELVVPAVADARGAAGEHWRTSMDVFNPGDRSARINVRPLPGSRFSGNTNPVALSIPAGSTVSVANAMAELFDATGSAALLMEVLEGDIVASSRTWQGDDGTVGQGIPATAVPDDLRPGDRLVVAGLHESDDRRTNLGLVNLEPFSVRVRLRLWSTAGDEGSAQTITLPSESLTQHNAVLADWPEPRPATGWAEIEILEQPARILAWSSVVDRGTSDPTYHQARVIPVE